MRFTRRFRRSRLSRLNTTSRFVLQFSGLSLHSVGGCLEILIELLMKLRSRAHLQSREATALSGIALIIHHQCFQVCPMGMQRTDAKEATEHGALPAWAH